MNDPVAADPARRVRPARLWLQAIITYTVAAGCLLWVFHDLNFGQLWHSLSGVRWWRLSIGMVLQVIAYLCVALEWQWLLRPVGRLSFVRTTQAVFAGRFTNDVLPVQLGYIVRVYLAARWMGKGLAAPVPSLLLERLLDGLWLAFGIFALTFFVALPPALVQARNILAAMVLGSTGLMAISALPGRAGSLQERLQTVKRWNPGRKVMDFIASVIAGLKGIARSRLLPAVLVMALLKLIVQGLAYYALAWAYGLGIGVWTALGAFLIAYLGIAVPSTPAGAGVFQLCSVLGLRLFGIAKEAATGFSLVAFVCLTAPLAILGFFAIAHSGLSLRTLRSEVTDLKERARQ
jgi:uncharacterized protein (TIRG00374 family)